MYFILRASCPPSTRGGLGSHLAALPNPVCHLAEHLLAGGRAALSLSVEVSSHVHIIRRLQGKEKKKKNPTILLLYSGQMARGGRLRVSAKHLEDVFAVTCSTSFLKAQLRSGEEAAVNASCTLPSLLLPPSAVLPSVHPSGAR